MSQTPETPSNKPTFENAGNSLNALSKAWEAQKETKTLNPLKKIWVFASTLLKEMAGIGKEKEKVTQETKDAVKGGIDETLKDLRVKTELAANTPDEDKKFYDEMLDNATKSFESFDSDTQARAYSAMNKAEKAMNAKYGEELPVANLDESTSLSAVALKTLLSLKDRYKDQSSLENALERLDAISDKSKFPIKRLFSKNVFEVFTKLDMSGYAKLSTLAGKFGIDMGDLGALAGLTNEDFTGERKEKAVNILKEKVFKDTSKDNVEKVAVKLNELIVKKGEGFNMDTLAELTFLIDNDDLERMIEILSDKK